MLSKYHNKYKKADTFVIVNEDPDLKPIKIPLPECPDITTIDGYGLKPEDQVFTRKELPARLKELQKRRYTDADENGKKVELTPRMKIEILEKNAKYYASEIEFIQNEWFKRENVYWFFNNGKPTCITGDHYFHCAYWIHNGEFFDFRIRDYKWFWFWYMVDNDDSCFGFNYPKPRREGATSKVSGVRWNRAARIPYYTTGLQSKVEGDAAHVHEFHVREPGKLIPFYFQPVQYGKLNNISEIRFFTPEARTHPDYGAQALSSIIDYKASNEKAYDGTKQHIIHNDEIGKTEDADVIMRVAIQIPCLMHLQKNSRKKGKMINTSTVDEMERGGGKQFKSICDDSDYYDRNENGETKSGLYNLFLSAAEGLEGINPKTGEPFIDKYGYSDKEAVTAYLLNTREALKKAGKTAAFIEKCRQFPLTWKDCWKSSAKMCRFNLIILQDRIDYYSAGNNDVVRGNFEWLGGIKFGKVYFQPNPHGRWIVSYQFKDFKFSNNQYHMDGMQYPGNKTKFIAGADPFKFASKEDRLKLSNGGGAVFYKFDPSVDYPGRSEHELESYRFVATYDYRQPTPEEYAEDMLRMCIYYGCEIFTENNVAAVWDYFRQNGFLGYLYFKFDDIKGVFEEKPGHHTGTGTKETMFGVITSYIERNGHRERHDELLKQYQEMEDDFGPFDLATASACALIGAGNSELYSDEPDTPLELSDFLPQYDIR